MFGGERARWRVFEPWISGVPKTPSGYLTVIFFATSARSQQFEWSNAEIPKLSAFFKAGDRIKWMLLTISLAALSRQSSALPTSTGRTFSQPPHGPLMRSSITRNSLAIFGKARAATAPMSRVLSKTGCSVISSDLHNRGFGDQGIDFLTATRKHDNNIVTNPPYNSAEGFVSAGIQKSKRKFALLLRLAFLEGANRANTIFSRNPPNRVWVFSERITFYPSGAVQKGTGTTAYAWFVWDKDASGTELKWFKPGYKARYL